MTDPAKPDDLRGQLPESWACIDCGFNTAPGVSTREQMEQAHVGVTQFIIGDDSEVYAVKAQIWKAASMEPYGGCLCIGRLEKRLGRMLMPRDFRRKHPLNQTPVSGGVNPHKDGGETRRGADRRWSVWLGNAPCKGGPSAPACGG
jgi:hypothetical protein